MEMEHAITSLPIETKPWWHILGYALATAAAVWILSTSSCEGPDEGGSGNPSHYVPDD